jgi:hypothetical protein
MNGSEAVDYIFATIDAGLITFDASRPGADTTTIVYALMMPPGTTSLLDPGGQYEGSSCQVFCGYHSGERGILFMVIVDPSCPGCAPSSLDNVPSSVLDIACSTLAHECVETVTDSDGTGWNDPNTGEENADICNRKLTPWGPWLIQGYFVNEHNPDEVEPDSDD